MGQEEQNRESQDKDSSTHEGKRKEKSCPKAVTSRSRHTQTASKRFLPTPKPPPLSVCCWSWHMAWNIFKSVLQVVSPLNFLSTLGLLAMMTVWQKGKILLLYKYCSTITKTPMAHFRHIPKTQHPMSSHEIIITTSEPNLAYNPSLKPGLSV